MGPCRESFRSLSVRHGKQTLLPGNSTPCPVNHSGWCGGTSPGWRQYVTPAEQNSHLSTQVQVPKHFPFPSERTKEGLRLIYKCEQRAPLPSQVLAWILIWRLSKIQAALLTLGEIGEKEVILWESSITTQNVTMWLKRYQWVGIDYLLRERY